MLKIWKILEKVERKNLVILLFLIIFSVLFELLSIGLIIPFTSIVLTESSHFSSFFNNFEFLKNLNNTQLTLFVCFIILLVFLIKNLFLSFFYYFEGYFLNSTIHNTSSRIFSNIIKGKLVYNNEFHSSEIVNDLTKEVVMFGNFLSACTLILTEIPIIICLSLLVLFYETDIFLILFFITGISTLIYFIIVKDKIKIIGRLRKKNEEVKLKYLQEGLAGIKEIKIYEKESFFINKYREMSFKIAKNYYKFNFYSKFARLFFELIFILLVVVIIIFFTYKSVKPSDYLPFLTLLFVASFRIMPGLNRIVSSLQTYVYTKIAMETVYKKLSSEKNTKNIKENKVDRVDKIDIKDVFFKYKDKNYILKNFSKTINKGDILAISGKSGSGKSTLLDLITGFKIPNEGNIYFDDYNNNLQSKNFFKQISYVPQSIFLFDDSIKNNIIFNDIENFDEKKFQFSIKISKLDDLLNRLPDRENTHVGEIGKKISGGEKQRIGIARAVYKNPDILILDEATNALDSETEEQIFSELQKFVNKKKILIFVSHKEELLKYSNKTVQL
ncbi:MAG: hypothetical protein CNB62_01725 [Pelagibacterales bacterium MED-G44]|nr:MAG: hypothetical protein CNB62_01725 [Pelagibacterales bacterium MED-G44]